MQEEDKHRPANGHGYSEYGDKITNLGDCRIKTLCELWHEPCDCKLAHNHGKYPDCQNIHGTGDFLSF
ncbi:hypothetical protein CRPA23_23490 [Pseudomonas aeruginosa]